MNYAKKIINLTVLLGISLFSYGAQTYAADDVRYRNNVQMPATSDKDNKKEIENIQEQIRQLESRLQKLKHEESKIMNLPNCPPETKTPAPEIQQAL